MNTTRAVRPLVAASMLAIGVKAAATPPTVSNVAFGKPVTASDPLFSPQSALATVTDGVFLPQSTPWNAGTVAWDRSRATVFTIDLRGAFDLVGLIVQADDNDAYAVEYHDPASGTWHLLWSVPNVDVYNGVNFRGMQTRPNLYENSAVFALPAVVRADRLRFFVDPISGDGPSAVSEVQAFGLEADCNGDGIGDVGQIRRGQLADYDGDNIPDCCEQATVCSSGPVPVEWRTADGGNGHWYQVILAERTWTAARADAQARGGHLATLGSAAERQQCFMLSVATPGAWRDALTGSALGPWLGAQQASGSAEPSGGWSWIDGTTFDATAAGASFNNSAGCGGANEDRLTFWCDSRPVTETSAYITSDFPERGFCESNAGPVTSAVVEWDADCNGDGKVDYGQILRGELVDAGGNGVPDECEYLMVPARYPTIQAAIDAATPSRRVVSVSAGTYAGAIDFKGKSVVVKAAGARANTIIDGTGLTTSVVRAVSGEGAGTVLEGFTIRNGPIGTAYGTYRLGGGMFMDHASPTVRDCAFVSNTAGFGGGVYGLFSSSLIENCTFSQNSASTDGGGVQFFAGSPVIRNCVVMDNRATNTGGGMHLVQHESGGVPSVTGCTIMGNRTDVNDGGGVSVYPHLGGSRLPEISGCVIHDNQARGVGGGVFAALHPLAPTPGVTLAGNDICGNLSGGSKRENVWALFSDGGNLLCDCLADIDGNRSVNTGDLAFALLFVGEATDPGLIQPDQDMNGLVDTGDIALVLLGFGACD